MSMDWICSSYSVQIVAGISLASIAKFSKEKTVSMKVLMKLYKGITIHGKRMD